MTKFKKYITEYDFDTGTLLFNRASSSGDTTILSKSEFPSPPNQLRVLIGASPTDSGYGSQLQILRFALERLGFKVDTAKGVQNYLEKMEQTKYHSIIFDTDHFSEVFTNPIQSTVNSLIESRFYKPGLLPRLIQYTDRHNSPESWRGIPAKVWRKTQMLGELLESIYEDIIRARPASQFPAKALDLAESSNPQESEGLASKGDKVCTIRLI